MKNSTDCHQQVMSFDFGTKHIGIAIGQTLTQSAKALCQINANNGLPDWIALDAIISEWQPDLFIVGLPLNMDGTKSHMSQRANKFANRLTDRYHIKCQLMDERLSSREVKSELYAQNHEKPSSNRSLTKKSKKPKEIDSLAAAVILQSWLNEQKT